MKSASHAGRFFLWDVHHGTVSGGAGGQPDSYKGMGPIFFPSAPGAGGILEIMPGHPAAAFPPLFSCIFSYKKMSFYPSFLRRAFRPRTFIHNKNGAALAAPSQAYSYVVFLRWFCPGCFPYSAPRTIPPGLFLHTAQMRCSGAAVWTIFR